ncbi:MULTISPECIES: helix-turn-helix domain-containing protein [Sphingobacterium]|uniref:helix-turn-helix domain-containing protein n=1 Tax=Sphingobacterium TaxID=28453 RepID=UPI000DF93561|nr:helix-turn-helix transcriptional regulator [Sphingobacterium multivorum]SUI99039.1 anaerobic benzoate catabolism transcriptional regulator [Sphingobacterium multivorum]
MATKNPRNEELIILFGKNVRKYREKKGLTMLQLAYACNVEYSTISTIERAIVNCSLSTAHSIAQALDISLDKLTSED